MASWMVHLRIADLLLSKLDRIDETAFVMGNIAPDSGVPNADWTEFRPPKTVSHFQNQAETAGSIDLDAFRSRCFHPGVIPGYSLREFSFFLGYYAHLLSDVRWSGTIVAALKRDFPEEYARDKRALVLAAKEDWYDLDFLYLEQHPDFRAFAVFEHAVGFENTFLDLFSPDAFENRRQYICGFYHGPEHGELHRTYRYLTPERADAFVRDTSDWIWEQIQPYLIREDGGR